MSLRDCCCRRGSRLPPAPGRYAEFHENALPSDCSPPRGAIAQPLPAAFQPPSRSRVRQRCREIPDRVYIDIGVTTQAQKSEAAAAENATRLSAVITAVKRAAGTGAELTTTEYSVNPNYTYPRNGGTPTLSGIP